MRDRSGEVFGEVGAAILPEVAGRAKVARRVVVRSGRPEARDDTEVWKLRMGGAMKAFDEALEAALAGWPENWPRGGKICVRPHAEDVVSDVPGTLGVLRRFGERVDVLVAPGDLITAEMVKHAGDHAARIANALVEQPGVVGVVLEDVAAVDGRVEARAPGAGAIGERGWREIWRVVKGSGKRVVLTELATEERMRWVEGL